MKKYILASLTFTLFIAIQITVFYFPPNGQSIIAIFNQHQLLLMPSTYVFSVQILIDLLLLIWLMLHHKQIANCSLQLKLFSNICLFYSGWLLCWYFEYFYIALFFIYGLNYCIWSIYQNYSTDNFDFSGRFPFSLLLGWSSFLTLLCSLFTVTRMQIYFFNNPTMTILILIGILCITVYSKLHYNDAYLAIIMIWIVLSIAQYSTTQTVTFVASRGTIIVSLIFISAIAIQRKKSELRQW